jgi:hypothetical protein
MDPLFFFLLGHLIGDYALQTDNMAASKNSKLILLVAHTTIYAVILALSAFAHDLFYKPPVFFSVLLWIVPIFMIHLLQDLIKVRHFQGSRQAYYIDQAIHLITIYALRIITGP